MYPFLFQYKYYYRYLRLKYLQVFYYTYLEFHNRHDMYILSLMSEIVLLVVLHGLCFAEKQKYHYVPEIISNTALSYALGFNTISLFTFIGEFNDIWLYVMSIFSLPVYTNG